MFDRRFDPRSGACPTFQAGEPFNDPMAPLVVKSTARVDVGLAWRWAICAAVASVGLVLSTPSAAQAGEIILALLGIPTLATAGTGGGAAAFIGTVVASVINGVIGAAVGFGINALSAPSQENRPGSIDALRGIYTGSVKPAVVCYGENVIGGLLCEALAATADGQLKKGGKLLHVCLAICRGPIESIDRITLNDEPATALKYRNKALFIQKLGFPDQSPISAGPYSLLNRGDGDPEGEPVVPPSWLEKTRRLADTAYVWAILKFDPEVFPSGAPGIRFRIKGKLCWDPREDVSQGGTQRLEDPTTWRYTNNPIVCTLDYLLDKVYGRGIPVELINLENARAAANECDQTLTITVEREKVAGQPDTETETIEIPKYRCDGAFLTNSRPDDILNALVTCFNGAVFPYAGLWNFSVGAAKPREQWPNDAVIPAALRGTDVVFDETHIRKGADFEFITAPGRQDKLNVVVPIYFNPDKDYQKDSAPPVRFQEFIDEDGEEFQREIELPFVANVHRARYIARQLYIKNRAGQRIKYPAHPLMLMVPPLARIAVSNTLYGLEEKDYLVEQVEFDPTTRQPNFQLREYSATEYDNPDDVVRLPPRTSLPDPLQPPDKPSLVTVAEALHTNPDQSRSAKLVVTITPPSDSLFDSYLIEWRRSGQAYNAARVAELPAFKTVHEIVGLQEGLYEVRVRTVFGFLKSDPYIVGARITYRTAPPTTPSFLGVFFDPNAGLWEYTAQVPAFPAHPDLTQMEFRYLEATDDDPLGVAVSDEWDRADLLGRVDVTQGGLFKRGTLRTLTPVKPASYVVYARSLDTTGLYSTGTVWQRITAQPVSSEILYRREFSEGGWTEPEAAQCGLAADPDNRGEVVDGRVANDGSLVARTQGTFGDILGQSVPWSELNPSRIVYLSPIIDLCADHIVTFDYDVRVEGSTAYRVEVRSRGGADEEWVTFRSPRGRLARWVQFRLTAWNATTLAKVHSFSVSVRDKLDRETIDDFDMAARAGTSREELIVDSRREHWLSGEHLGTDVGAGGLTLDEETAVALDGATTITAPDADALDLTSNSWTIEFEIGFDSAATGQSDVVVIGKGTAWQLVWNADAVQFFRLKSTGYSGDNPGTYFWRPPFEFDPDFRGPYHVALTYSQGFLRGYVNGKRPFGNQSAGAPRSFTLPTNSDPITIGQNLAGTLKNIRIWDHARSQAQLSAFRGATVDPNTPGLIRQWRCSDGSGTTIKDFSPAKSNATMTDGAWCRIGVRTIVPVDLGIVRLLTKVRVGYFATIPANTSVAVQARLTNMDGSTTFPLSYGNWATVSPSAALDYTFRNGTQQHTSRGVQLQVRQILRSDDVATAPTLLALVIAIGHNVFTGEATVLTRDRFSRIDQMGVTAIQSPVSTDVNGNVVASVEPRPPVLVAKSVYGGRFQVKDVNGQRINPVIDVLVQGSRLRETA